MLGRASHLERVSRWLARRSRSCRCGSHASSSPAAARSTATIAELDQELEQRTAEIAPALLELPGCGADHRREAARRDRPDRPLQKRRAARPTQRRRAARSELRPHPTPPARPRRQPPTQRRALPNRDHPSPLPPRRARLPRTQTSRRQEPPRSDPLPQTTPRPRRLQHTQSEPRLDIGATLAQPTGLISESIGATEGACVAGRRHRDIDDRFAGTETAVLLGREKVVRELPPNGYLRPDQDAPVELSGAVGAGCGSRVPTLLRCTLDPLPFARPATRQQQGDRADDAQDGNSLSCGIRARRAPALPFWRL